MVKKYVINVSTYKTDDKLILTISEEESKTLSNIFSKCYFHTYIKISTDHQFEFERKS
jgi:hypothetical protein